MKATIEITPTIQQLAEVFCEWSDDEQAQFFIAVAEIGRRDFSGPGKLGADWQFDRIGAHLRTCSCSTEDARDMVRSIFEGMTREPAAVTA